MATIKDIAKKANVTHATVSRILNNKGQNHSIKTIEKVFSIAKELNYELDDMARAVKTGKSKVISYIGRDIHMASFKGLVAGAKEHEYVIEPLFVNRDDPGHLQQILEHIAKKRISGVCISYNAPSVNLLVEKLKKAKIPCALSLRLPETPHGILSVNSDQAQGMRIIGNHLYLRGHRRICYMGGKDYGSLYLGDMLKKALKQKDSKIQLRSIRGSFEMHKSQTGELMKSKKDRPTAICVSNPGSLVIVMMQLYALGCKIPEDISVVGYGDYPYASLLPCPVTVAKERAYEQGELISRKLIHMIKTQTQMAMEELFDLELVVRDSVAKI